ncbi:YlbF family regulator [Enterococcus faecalis]|nr:YlbF family regulator [Enterococcus faecalis]
MIVTEHLFAIEDQTECLISALLESDAVQNYKETKKAMYASREVAQLQKTFLEAKSAFERVEAYGIHASDFREKQRALRKAKRALDLNEIVANYRFAETNVQTLLDTIGLKIAQLISEDIKVDAGNPFFERGKKHSGCGGSCHAS